MPPPSFLLHLQRPPSALHPLPFPSSSLPHCTPPSLLYPTTLTALLNQPIPLRRVTSPCFPSSPVLHPNPSLPALTPHPHYCYPCHPRVSTLPVPSPVFDALSSGLTSLNISEHNRTCPAAPWKAAPGPEGNNGR